MLKPGSPTGSLDLEPDGDGNLWLALMFQAGVAKFDMKTKTFQLFPVQADLDNDATQQSMVMPRASKVDGKVWSNEVAKQSIMRLDLEDRPISSSSIRSNFCRRAASMRRTA